MNIHPWAALFEGELAELVAKQAQVTTAYDYEKIFDEWSTALEKEVFQDTLAKEPGTVSYLFVYRCRALPKWIGCPAKLKPRLRD